MLPVPFVGPLRSKVLEKAGYTLEKLKSASVEELAKLEGFSESLAKSIIKYSKMVQTPKALPSELNFKEFKCPNCNAIVSEAEPICHKCGHVFFEHSENYQNIQDELASVIAKLYHDPSNSKLWREGEKLLLKLGNEVKAADFKFKASSLELKSLETPPPIIKKPKNEKITKRGYTNGLVNGLGTTPHEVHKSMSISKIKILIIGLIIIAPILMAGMLTLGSTPAIVIDGHFNDWKNIKAHGSDSQEFTVFKMKTYGENTYMYIQGPTLFTTQNFKLGVLIDRDSNNRTGFPVNSMGIDSVVWIYSINDTKNAQIVNYENQNWVTAGTVNFAISGNAIELKTIKINEHSSILLYYSSPAGEWYSSIYTPTNHVWAVSSGGEVLNPGENVVNITFWNSGTGTVRISSFTIKNLGNATAKIKLEVEGIREETTILPGNTIVTFSHAITIGPTPTVMNLVYQGGGKKYETIQPYLLNTANFTFIERANGAYISAIPTQKAIDGIFLDWHEASQSPRSNIPENIDLSRYASDDMNNLKIYMSVYGTIFGVGIPKIKTEHGNGTGGNITNNTLLPRDTVEIFVDTDKNPTTGFKIGNIGAEYRIMMYGKLGTVNRIQAYRWVGRWIAVDMPIKYAKNANSIEIGLNLKGNVYYRLVNWEGVWDKECGLPAKHSKLIIPTKIGDFNSTELFTRFGTDVNVTAGLIYNQTVPSIVSNGTTLYVAFDAGYEYNGNNISIGFAVSSDNGATWTAYYFTNIYGSYPVVTVNDYGDVYIFFENHTSGSYFEFLVHYHTNGTDSSNTPLWTLSSITTWNFWSNVYYLSAAGKESYVYVAFTYAGSSYDTYTIFSGNSNIWSATWTLSLVSSSVYDEFAPRIAISSGSSLYVFITYTVSVPSSLGSFNYDAVYFNYTTAGSTKWSTGQRLTASDGTDQYDDDLWPDVGASNNYAYIIWEHKYYSTSTGEAYNIDLWFANISISSGSVVTTEKIAAGTNYWEQAPSIWVTGSNIYVAYYNSTNTGEYIYYIHSNDGGNLWSSPLQISDNGEVNTTIPMVNIYANGSYVYIVWSDDSPSSTNQEYADIFFDKESVPELNSTIVIFLMVALVLIVPRRKNLSTRRHARPGEKNVRSIQVQQKRKRD